VEAVESLDLVEEITTRMKQVRLFVDKSVESAYFDALIEHDHDIAAPIVRQMLAQNREPWTSTELARKVYNASHRPESSQYEPPTDTRSDEERQQAFRSNLIEGADPDTYFGRWVRRRWSGEEEQASA